MTTQSMKEVSKEDFYKLIYDGKLDLTLSVLGDFPYTTEFKLRGSPNVWGKVIESYSDGKHYPIITKFYIL